MAKPVPRLPIRHFQLFSVASEAAVVRAIQQRPEPETFIITAILIVIVLKRQFSIIGTRERYFVQTPPPSKALDKCGHVRSLTFKGYNNCLKFY
jgi:hypothetical protein